MDEVSHDISTLEVRIWRSVDMNRGRMAKSPEEGQDPQGAVEPMMMMIFLSYIQSGTPYIQQ